MPTSSPSNVTTKENPPNDSATPTAKSSEKPSAATAKEKEKEKKSTAGAAGKGSMGARLSTAPGSAGKAPSTASASSTHTASTVPADSAEVKGKAKSGGGVAGFLRRKPSSKDPAAGSSSGSEAKKDAKKGVGSSLRTSLFRRSNRSKNGADAPATAAGPAVASSSSSTASAAANSSSGAKSSASSTSAAKPPTGASTSTDKGRTTPEKGRASPEKRSSLDKGRASPQKRTSPDKSPAGRRGASPPKSQRRSSEDSSKKSPSPKPSIATAAAGTSKALTPQQKEALKKHWFTDGKPLPEPAGRGRATGRTGAGTGSRTEPRSRPGAGETVGPPATASRAEGSAFSVAAAKFGGVKAPAKPRPGSPKKSDKSPTGPKKTTGAPGSPKKAGGALGGPKKAGGAPGSPKKSEGAPGISKKPDASAKPATAEGMGDLMEAMAGFKTEDAGKSKDANAKEDNAKVDVKPSAKDETVTSSVSTSLNAKADVKAPASGGGLDDLMGAMEGFNPSGSKTDKSKRETTNNGMETPESKHADSKEEKDKPKDGVVSGKDDAKTADEKGGGLDDLIGAMKGFNPDGSKTDESKKEIKEEKEKPKSGVISGKDDSKTVDEKGGAKDDKGDKSSEKETSDVTKKDEKHAKEDKHDTAPEADVKHDSKDDSVTPKDDLKDVKAKDSPRDAEEPKAEKTSTWRPGDEDSGELGLGGISQKDREERAQRPSAPKDQAVDLDFLMGQIDTTPKPKKDSPKVEKKKPADKDAGLGDLMDLAKGFDMSAMSKPEPVVAKAETASDLAPSDMDKFLDMMDTTPAKPSAPPAGPPVKEEELAKKDTWRTGDGDDEAMIALMNKPRDRDAPSQPPDWDIDDLLVGEVIKKPEAKEEKPVPEKKADSGFSRFDSFIGDSLSGDVAKDKQSGVTTKASAEKDDKKADKGTDKKESEKAFSGFDDFLSESLSGKESASGGDSKRAADTPVEKEPAAKKPAGGEFAAFDDFLSSSPSAGDASKKAADKPAEEKPADKKPTGDDFSAFDDFLSSSAPDKDSAGGPIKEDPVAAPKKVTAVDSAPPAPVEEEMVAAVASSQTTAAPVKPKPAQDKHRSKEGDTRGSVPDHGHGVRDLLYDDKDKTGTKPSSSHGDAKSREPAMLDDLIRPAKASTASSAPPAASKEEAVVAQTASTTEAGKPTGKKVTDEHREKPGNTRGSVPDHGHGVRDVLYDDSDKTGRKKSDSKDDTKSREPAALEDLIQPKKVAASHAAPGDSHAHSSEDEEEDEETSISAETAHQSQASGQTAGKKKRRARKKKQAKEGDTRGSVPDQGHGVRDVLYDDSDKTGRKKTPSESKGDAKPKEPTALDDLIQPKKAAASHAAPAARTPSPESKKTEEVVTAQTAHQAQASAAPSGKKANKKKQSKEGDTRGSVPDHGHGVRDVLYDDKDKTGRRKSDSKEQTKPREPAPLDDLIQPKKAAVSHAAAPAAAPAKKTPSRSPSPDGEDDEISAETAYQPQSAPGQGGAKKKRRSRKKKQHARDTDGAAASSAGPEQPLVAEKASSAQSAPPAAAAPPTAAAPPSPKHQEPEKKSLSLAGMTDPDQEDSDDGEELRRLIASTEALHAQLHSASRGDSKQAQVVQEQTSQELERLERNLEQRERRLESAGRGHEVKAAREGLQKVKHQLDASRAGSKTAGH